MEPLDPKVPTWAREITWWTIIFVLTTVVVLGAAAIMTQVAKHWSDPPTLHVCLRGAMP